MRTSHASLHSVAEVTEPDEHRAAYNAPPPTLHHSSLPPRPQDLPQIPVGASIRRKPLSTAAPPPEQLSSPVSSPVADRGSHGHFSLLRPAVLQQDHSNSSSSGMGATLSSPETSRRSSDNTVATEEPASPISPLSPHCGVSDPFTHDARAQNPSRVSDPFTNAHSYVEDYGPEYQHGYGYGYVDESDGLYGGHRSLDAYPVVPEKSERRGSKGALRGGMTEWPLREWPLKSLGSTGRGRGARERSPQWDRVYEA